jgi:hypothetical protein
VIGMWGSSGSGKTTYLMALHYEILRHKEHDERWGMVGDSDAAHKFLVDGYNQFKVLRQFPDKTVSRNALEPLRFDISRPYDNDGPQKTPRTGFLGMISDFWSHLYDGGSDRRHISLDLFDPAGDLFSEPDRLMGDTDPMAAPCREKLANSLGLLCMIDPERADDQEYFPLIYPNFVNLSRLTRGEGGGPLQIPVAICVMKADQFPAAFDDPMAFVKKHLGMAAYGTLVDFCEVREFFAVSAVGENNVEKDERGMLRPKGLPEPRNVLQPLDWLLTVVG